MAEAINPFGAGTREIAINRQMLARARGELGDTSAASAAIDAAARLNTTATNAIMRGLLERIAQSNELMAKPQLESPPPRPDGRQ